LWAVITFVRHELNVETASGTADESLDTSSAGGHHRRRLWSSGSGEEWCPWIGSWSPLRSPPHTHDLDGLEGCL